MPAAEPALLVTLRTILDLLIEYTIVCLEFIAILIIIYGSVLSLFMLVKKRLDFGEHSVKLQLSQTLSMALSFLLAAEILKTFGPNSLVDLCFVGALIAIRIIISFVILHEIKVDKVKEEYQDTLEQNQIRK